MAPGVLDGVDLEAGLPLETPDVYAFPCIIPGQGVVAERTVNPFVVGSSPTPGAKEAL